MTTLTSLLDHLCEGDVVNTADLARVSDTNPRSVARWKADAATPRRDAEERLLELRAVVDLARRVMRDDAARFWMRSPNPDLGYEKPLDLIAAGQYQRVVDLLLASFIKRENAASSATAAQTASASRSWRHVRRRSPRPTGRAYGRRRGRISAAAVRRPR